MRSKKPFRDVIPDSHRWERHEMDCKRSIQLRVLYRTMTKKTSPFRIP